MATISNCFCGVLFLLLCGDHGVSQTRVAFVHNSQLGVREEPKGSNWGLHVQMYLASVNVRQPAPWCAAFVHWCLNTAGIKNTITAWSPTAHNSQHVLYAARRLISEPEAGDVFTLWYPKLNRIAHTGFYHRRINKSVYESVEGNTNEAGSREGDGVYKKYRSFHATYSITRWR